MGEWRQGVLTKYLARESNSANQNLIAKIEGVVDVRRSWMTGKATRVMFVWREHLPVLYYRYSST